jgi:hypothetical protein
MNACCIAFRLNCVRTLRNYSVYHTGAIITRGLYIFEDPFFVFKKLFFSENYVLNVRLVFKSDL